MQTSRQPERPTEGECEHERELLKLERLDATQRRGGRSQRRGDRDRDRDRDPDMQRGVSRPHRRSDGGETEWRLGEKREYALLGLE
jgi:hypothetical protein